MPRSCHLLHALQPFRRRGYERDSLLRLVIERAGFLEMYEASRAGSQAETLATVPSAVAHFALDALFERPVQAQLAALLLLKSTNRRFTSCVIVHGMGGTGKVSGVTYSHLYRLILTSLLALDGDGGGR